VDTGDERLDSWQATELDLRAALAAANVVGALAIQVEEYLDHNELGLAFAELVIDLDRRGTPVPTDALAHLSSAIDRMGESSLDADAAEAWERVSRTPPA
jgi:hypothetical protein